MLNKVLLIGFTTRAIELRYLPSGSAVAKSGIAVNRTWKDKNTGEKKEETMKKVKDRYLQILLKMEESSKE